MKSAQGEMSKPCDSEQPVGCRDRTKGGKIKKQSRFFFSSFSLSSGLTPRLQLLSSHCLSVQPSRQRIYKLWWAELWPRVSFV